MQEDYNSEYGCNIVNLVATMSTENSIVVVSRVNLTIIVSNIADCMSRPLYFFFVFIMNSIIPFDIGLLSFSHWISLPIFRSFAFLEHMPS